MNKKIKDYYYLLVVLHIFIGVISYSIPFMTKIFSILVFVWGLSWVIKTKNRSNEALKISAYVTGVEVFFRMTNGMHFTEYGKYSIIIFMCLGLFYSGLKKKSLFYVLFIVLLVPGVFVAIQTLNLDTDFRKAIAFNISGPVCLGVSSIYCIGRDVSFDDFKKTLTFMALPIITTTAYIVSYNPSVSDVVRHTQSNFAASGNYGPNQVSTILGLGMFLFFFQILFNSKSKVRIIVNTILLVIVSYRAIVTFSRGGVMAGLVMIAALSVFTYLFLNVKAKGKMLFFGVLGLGLALTVWGYSVNETGGMIDKRYKNQGVNGQEKDSQLSGRETLMDTELQMFYDNPIFGIGVGKNKEYREELTGILAASHNEITRMLAEHGIFGLFGLLLLFTMPGLLYLENKKNIFLFSFFFFWCLTINHAAMRLAAPAFVYALALLNVTFLKEDENTLHRK
jgi:O-antigen ligase